MHESSKLCIVQTGTKTTSVKSTTRSAKIKAISSRIKEINLPWVLNEER